MSYMYSMSSMKHILLNKYDCYIAYVSHTTNILNGYTDPTVLHICTKTQPTALYTSHIIAKCVLETKYAHQIGHICHIYQISDRLIWKMYTHLCVTHDITIINHVVMATVHIFEMYH